MKPPIRALIPMALLAPGLAAFGWWLLGDVSLIEGDERKHVDQNIAASTKAASPLDIRVGSDL